MQLEEDFPSLMQCASQCEEYERIVSGGFLGRGRGAARVGYDYRGVARLRGREKGHNPRQFNSNFLHSFPFKGKNVLRDRLDQERVFSIAPKRQL